MPSLHYLCDEMPPVEAVAGLYDAAGLRRPTFDRDRLRRMLQGSNVLLSCWDESGEAPLLVGFLRGWTDFAYDGYVCDLAVHPDFQKRGIGAELLARVKSIGAPEVQWILLASAIAKDYYAHVGWEAVPNAWKWLREGYVHPADGNPG